MGEGKQSAAARGYGFEWATHPKDAWLGRPARATEGRGGERPSWLAWLARLAAVIPNGEGGRCLALSKEQGGRYRVAVEGPAPERRGTSVAVANAAQPRVSSR